MARPNEYVLANGGGTDWINEMLKKELKYDEDPKASRECYHNCMIFSNVEIGQYTGVPRYFDGTDNKTYCFIDIQCSSCYKKVKGYMEIGEFMQVPPLQNSEFDKVKDALNGLGCNHVRSWMLSRPVIDQQGKGLYCRIAYCLACKKRAKIV